MDHWTSAEKETCKPRYDCEIIVENGTYADVCTKEAPRDCYIIKYVVDGEMCFDLTRGGNDSLSSLRRETMFINLLQGLHPLEAEILMLCKDKKLGEKYKLTKELVAEAYPDIKWGNRS